MCTYQPEYLSQIVVLGKRFVSFIFFLVASYFSSRTNIEKKNCLEIKEYGESEKKTTELWIYIIRLKSLSYWMYTVRYEIKFYKTEIHFSFFFFFHSLQRLFGYCTAKRFFCCVFCLVMICWWISIYFYYVCDRWSSRP